MIWNDAFVWLHFPKCAGIKTAMLFYWYFRDRADIRQDIVDARVDPLATWHDSLQDRERRDAAFARGDRTIVCAVRRLPSWLESRYSYEVGRNPAFPHDPERLLAGRYLDVAGHDEHADDVVRHYLPPDVLGSPRLRFLRAERFEEDFRAIFSAFVDTSRIPPQAFRSKENATVSRVPAAVRAKLFDDNAELYRRCPAWRRVELAAYGDTWERGGPAA